APALADDADCSDLEVWGGCPRPLPMIASEIQAMRLIIVRHGESEWNRVGRYQGQCDAPLSDLGLRQAEALARRLSDEPLDVIFTSPLQRAAKTAEAIARYHPNTPFEH